MLSMIENYSFTCLVADTCIWYQGEIIGKPSNLDDAFNILTKLSGNTHSVYTTIQYNLEILVK